MNWSHSYVYVHSVYLLDFSKKLKKIDIKMKANLRNMGNITA